MKKVYGIKSLKFGLSEKSPNTFDLEVKLKSSHEDISGFTFKTDSYLVFFSRGEETAKQHFKMYVDNFKECDFAMEWNDVEFPENFHETLKKFIDLLSFELTDELREKYKRISAERAA